MDFWRRSCHSHQAGFSSRRCQSSTCASSHRPCSSGLRRSRSAGTPSVRASILSWTSAARAVWPSVGAPSRTAGRSQTASANLSTASARRSSSQVAKHQRRDAVVAVVVGDPIEDRLVPFGHPALVLDDAEPSLGHGSFPLRHVELLDLLERVGLDRCADPLANDVQEVDEHPATQEAVDLVFARGVALHQPLHRPRLVAAVVVDVHVGVAVEPVDEEVDQRLERRLLLLAVVTPDRKVRRLTIELQMRHRAGIRGRRRTPTDRPRCRRRRPMALAREVPPGRARCRPARAG